MSRLPEESTHLLTKYAPLRPFMRVYLQIPEKKNFYAKSPHKIYIFAASLAKFWSTNSRVRRKITKAHPKASSFLFIYLFTCSEYFPRFPRAREISLTRNRNQTKSAPRPEKSGDGSTETERRNIENPVPVHRIFVLRLQINHAWHISCVLLRIAHARSMLAPIDSASWRSASAI